MNTDTNHAWITVEAGRRSTLPPQQHDLRFVSRTGDLMSGSLRIVFDGWPSSVDVSEFMSPSPPERRPGETGFFMYEVVRPKRQVHFSDGTNYHHCTVESYQGNRVTCFVTSALNLRGIQKVSA